MLQQPIQRYGRVLDVGRLASAAMRPADRADLHASLLALASCELGTRLLVVALDHDLEIAFAGHGILRGFLGAAAGRYEVGRHRITLARGAGRDELTSILAHELQHFADHMLGWPLDTIACEVRAYQTQALVVLELWLRVGCHGLSEQRALRSREQLVEVLRGRPRYRSMPEGPATRGGRLHSVLDDEELLLARVAPREGFAPRSIAEPRLLVSRR